MRNQWLHRAGMGKTAIALVLIFGSLNTFADNSCSTLYASSGAIQGTRTCVLDVASGASGGMGSYACLADIAGIRAWCAATPVPDPSQDEQDDNCPIADPVFSGSGAVTLTTSDFESGDDSPLSFERTDTSNRTGRAPIATGAGWFHNWQRWLDLTDSAHGPSSTVIAYRSHGEPVRFRNIDGNWHTPGFTGLALQHHDSGWTLTDLQSETTETGSSSATDGGRSACCTGRRTS